MSPPRDPLFEAAEDQADLSAYPGLTVYRAGRRWRGPCPICSAGEKRKADGPFWTDGRRWGCFAGGAGSDCERGGDAVRLEQLLRGGSAVDAARRIVGDSFVPAQGFVRPDRTAERQARAVAREAEREADLARKDAFAARLRRESRQSPGGPVETYLHGRGLPGDIVQAALPALRFHPSAYWGHDDEADRPIRAPAMCADLIVGKGEAFFDRLNGAHVTYLAADGRTKADLTPAKRMWGAQLAADGRPGGILLIDRGPGPLIVAEGIENALSAAAIYLARTGVMPRAAASGSLDRLQGGWKHDAFDRYDPEAPAGDPDRPPFVLHERVGVLIAVDRDMSPIEVRVRGPGGRTKKRWLNAEARARICGSLAEQAWRRVNPHLETNRVRAIAPPPGLDFNDWLKGGAAYGA